MSLVAMPTIEERERLIPECRTNYSGFQPRSVQKLATRKKPISLLDLECRHFLRTKSEEFTNGQPSIERRLWIEAGKCAAPYPRKPDANYNSNVWRNFRKQFGFSTSAEGRKISDVIAAMYPLNIPPPSKIGENSFTKYICDGGLYQDDKFHQLAIKQTTSDHEEMKRLKIKSESRKPPIDQDGKILPPENFKKYIPRFIPPQNQLNNFSPPLTDDDYRTDLFGRRYVKNQEAPSKPYLWKLTYRLSKPQYSAVQAKIQEQRDNKQRQSHVTAPSPSSP